jgi:Ca-activated chloride channel family protein
MDPESPRPGLPDEDAIPGTGISLLMMEQWLEQIEGDPAYLLRNQFMIEERLELEKRGRMLMETRPW